MATSAVNSEPATGTSIMACEFDGGVVIGADSRATRDRYITNRVVDKLTRITDHIYCCRTGSAADTQAVSDIVAYHLNFHMIELGEAPMVKTAASIFRELCYNYRDNLNAGFIVAGWDKKRGDFHMIELGEAPMVKTAASIFRELCYNYRDNLNAGFIVAGWDKKRGGQIYSIPRGGMVQRQPVSIDGSGSVYVNGYVDANFRPDMTQEEAVDFVADTIALAMSLDHFSGGVIRLGVVTEAGVQRTMLKGDQLTRFFDG